MLNINFTEAEDI